MSNFVMWLVSNFGLFISTLTGETIRLIDDTIMATGFQVTSLGDFNINLVLFSETPILVTNGKDLLTLFFSVFYTIIFVVIVYKIIKKVFVKITGWKRW